MNENNKYASEKFTPKSPACGKSVITLLFNGKDLIMTSGVKVKKTYKYTADSGKPNHLGKFSYSKRTTKNAL